MKKGFTIIELLVASALLGMLVTILTMIFNQSSIAWRIGVAGVSDLGDMRATVGSVREVADNAFIIGNQGYRLLGLWDSEGNFRNRTCDAKDLTDSHKSSIQDITRWFFNLQSSLSPSEDLTPRDFKSKNAGRDTANGSYSTYTVNVMSGGPANDVEDWQAIWSFPDDPNEW